MGTTFINKSEMPSLDAIVWRYMSLPKWLSLLSSRSLFFTRIDQLGDDFEGYIPTSDRLLLHPDSPPFEGMDVNSTLRVYHEMAWAWRYHFYVNCWTMASTESVAMWRLYAPSSDGVLIRSTVGKILEFLNSHEHRFFVGAVKYLDADDPLIVRDIAELMFLKRSAFGYEQELRFAQISLTVEDVGDETQLCLDPNEIQIGKSIDVPIEQIIDGVRIAPDCPSWIAEVILETTARYCPELEFEKSDLKSTPVWDVPVKPQIVLDSKAADSS